MPLAFQAVRSHRPDQRQSLSVSGSLYETLIDNGQSNLSGRLSNYLNRRILAASGPDFLAAKGVSDMSYPLFIPGFENQEIDVVPSGFVRGPRLLLNGNLAPAGPGRNQYVLARPDGSKTIIKLKPTLLDPVPKVIVDGEQIEVVPSLGAMQLVWSGITLVLIFVGGALGGFIGGAAYWTNIIIFRSEMSRAEKYILTALVSGIALVLYLIASVLLSTLFFD